MIKYSKLMIAGFLLLIFSFSVMPCMAGKIIPPKGYPTHPIEYIIPWGVGGGADVMSRMLCKVAEKITDVKLVPLNYPGAAGVAGVNELMSRPADGYSLVAILSDWCVSLALKNTKYTVDDIVYLVRFSHDIETVTVKSRDPRFPDWQSLVNYARGKPGKLSVATSGTGSIDDVILGILEQAWEFTSKHVPFVTLGERSAAILGGHTDAIQEQPGDLYPLVKEGKLKPLIVLKEERIDHPVFKDVPTAKELGHELTMAIWRGIGAKKGTPKKILTFWEKVFLEAQDDPEFKALMQKRFNHLRVGKLGSKEFTEVVHKDLKNVIAVFKQMGIMK